MHTFNGIGSGSIFSALGSNSSSISGSQTSSNEAEASNVPSDTISRLRFSPASLSECYLLASSWSGDVSCWQVDTNNCTSLHKAQKCHGAPVLDCCWSGDGQYVFTAGTDNAVRGWSLAEDKYIQVGGHDAPVKTVNFIQRPSYTCLMTGSWDKTLRFWDLRSSQPMWTMNLEERIYCADNQGPMAVVITADRQVRILQLDPNPSEYGDPKGYVAASIEGRVGVNVVASANSNDTFSFKCHRTATNAAGYQEVYAVNEVAVHPIHNTILTVGSDGKYGLWDKDSRTKLKSLDLAKKQPLTACDIDQTGKVAAYAEGYDWHKGHEGSDLSLKPHIYLRPIFEDMKQKQK